MGGLNLRNMHNMDKALLMKINWGLINNKDSLWARVARGKYQCSNACLPTIKKIPSCSNLWRGIARTWKDFESGIGWFIRDGKTTKFWTDVWVHEKGQLIKWATQNIPNSDICKIVSDYIDATGQWDRNILNNVLPQSIYRIICNIFPHCQDLGPDLRIWVKDKDHSFQYLQHTTCLLIIHRTMRAIVGKEYGKLLLLKDARASFG